MRVGARVSAVTSSMSSEGSARRGAGRVGCRGGGRGGGRGGRRPGRGRGRGGDAGSSNLSDRDAPDFGVRLSKRMSHLLRHGAVEASLGDVMDASGYVPVRDVLALPRFAGITEADVRHLVASCPKRRFELRGELLQTASEESDGVHRDDDVTNPTSFPLSIRAAQGHTMRSFTKLDDDQMLTRLDEETADAVSSAAHGTSLAAWAKIRDSGISRAKRRHVHMARDVQTISHTRLLEPRVSSPYRDTHAKSHSEGTREGVWKAVPNEPENVSADVPAVSGFRENARVAIWVDVKRGVREGVPFFLSSNGVVLSPGEGDTGIVPPRLFLRAVDLKTGEALALAGADGTS